MRLHEESLALREEALGQDHEDVAKTLSKMAVLARDQVNVLILPPPERPLLVEVYRAYVCACIANQPRSVLEVVSQDHSGKVCDLQHLHRRVTTPISPL